MAEETKLSEMSEAERAYEEWMDKAIAEGLPRPKPKRKAIVAEVSPRMHAVVKANPDKLRMIGEDAQGNAVIERPYRPPTRDDRCVPENAGSAVGQIKWGHNPWGANGVRSPFRQGPALEREDAFVSRDYDIYVVLRGDD